MLILIPSGSAVIWSIRMPDFPGAVFFFVRDRYLSNQQLPTDASSQLLEQMNTLGGFSGGGNSSTGNNPFVTIANPLSVNTSVTKMTGKPAKKKRKVQFGGVQSSFSFINYQEDERSRKKNKGMEQLDLGSAKADSWTAEAKQCYDLVHLLFPKSLKPESESVANAVDVMLTAQFHFGQSTERNAVYPFAERDGENVQFELRDFFDDEEGGLHLMAQKMQYLAELAQLRNSNVRDELAKVLQTAEKDNLNQDEEGGKDSISKRVGLFVARKLEKQMNAQGAREGVLGTSVISYPRTVQILAGYGDLHRESLLGLVEESGMADHLTFHQQLKLTNEPEGREVRRFAEEFFAEFVALDGGFSDYLTMLKGMVEHMKKVALADMPHLSTAQQQSETQVRPQWMSAPAPQDNDAFVTGVTQQSGYNNAQGFKP